jgi:membrane-associated phospholipid phosphatase
LRSRWAPELVSGAVLLPLGVFAALALAVSLDRGLGWDAYLLQNAEQSYRASLVTALDTALRVSIAVGATVAVAAVVLLLARRRRERALFWLLATVGVAAFDVLLKAVFRRPALGGHEGSYSFPSGNAMGSVVVASAIVLTAASRWRRPLLVAAVPAVLAYGAALVYAWWHYPTDVIAGWCFGAAWVASVWLTLGCGAPAERAGTAGRRALRELWRSGSE